MVTMEVEGLGPCGHRIGDYHIVMTSPREVIRLLIKCSIELGGGATRVWPEERDEEREIAIGRIG